MDNTDLYLSVGGLSVFALVGICITYYLCECGCKQCKHNTNESTNGDYSLSEV